MAAMRWFSVLRGTTGVALVVLVSSCQLDRAGISGGSLPSNNAKLVVEPELPCPTDSVAARWDLTMLPRAAPNCRRCATTTSERVRIATIRDTNSFPIVLTGGVPRRDGIRIEPGGITTAFAGSRARGLWVAFIPADGRGAFPAPVCGRTEVMNRLPDIDVELRLACRCTP